MHFSHSSCHLFIKYNPYIISQLWHLFPPENIILIPSLTKSFCPFQCVSPNPMMLNLYFSILHLTFSNFAVIFKSRTFHVPTPSLSLLSSRFILPTSSLFQSLLLTGY